MVAYYALTGFWVLGKSFFFFFTQEIKILIVLEYCDKPLTGLTLSDNDTMVSVC